MPTSVVGGPDAAADILSTVAASMVSLTALVLTITMVVVQLAMGQFSPRIVQRILRDKPSQLAIGLFVATFVHAILALREVTINGDGTGNVPGLAVVTAFTLVLVSIAVLVIYVHHIGQALRVSALIELVGDETRTLLDRRYPDKGPALASEANGIPVVCATESGVDHRDRLRATCRGRTTRGLPPRARSSPRRVRARRRSALPRPRSIRGSGRGPRARGSHRQLEPTLDEDVAYGVRLLVDIASARSPTSLSKIPQLQCKRSTDSTTS